MELTKEQQGILDGEQGEVRAKIMKTLVMYGETFNAPKMIPVSKGYGHFVTSFGLSVMKPVYELMDKLIEGGALAGQKFSVDPRPLDKNVPANFLQKIFFNVMYSKQSDYEKQLETLGILSKDSFTCTCYMPQVGNVPQKGDILSWAESSAVVYANSVLGAKCNRNSGIIEMFGSIIGFVPYFGLLTDEGRRATWIVKVKTTKTPEAQVLGSAIGMKVMEDVPYITGLSDFIGNELNETTKSYLKDMGAATASNGAVGLYHIENLTPEAKEQGMALVAENAQVYEIDDEELLRVEKSYPCMWKDKDATPKLCFIGCPHLSLEQLNSWTQRVITALKASGMSNVSIPTVFTAAPKVLEEFNKSDAAKQLEKTGVITSYICPLMYMNNPMCGKMPVITNSNKLRTYTSSRYYTDDAILAKITAKEAKI
ncbi:MAG: aconitase X [Oscillospiraceae bacterium]